MDKKIFTVKSLTEMEEFASSVLADLKSGAVLLLYGELGAGKTTFTKALAAALGITGDVTSPTFTIFGEYTVTGHEVFTLLVHADLYRFVDSTASRDPMIGEMLAAASLPGRLTVIEWAERLGNMAIPGAIRISFRHGAEENTRIAEIG